MQHHPPPPPKLGDLGTCLQRMDWARAFRQSLMDGKVENSLPYAEPLLDAVALFDSLGIDYALVGGVAMMFYGRPRPTEDVDFVATTGHMEVLAKNPEAVRAAHFDPNCTWKLYHDSGVDIDLWKDEFVDAIISRAKHVMVNGKRVKVADPTDLVAMKLRADRVRDDGDIAEIVVKSGVDEAMLRSLVSDEQFTHYEQVRDRARRS